MLFALQILFLLFLILVLIIGFNRLQGGTVTSRESALLLLGNNIIGALLIAGCLIAVAIVVAS